VKIFGFVLTADFGCLIECKAKSRHREGVQKWIASMRRFITASKWKIRFSTPRIARSRIRLENGVEGKFSFLLRLIARCVLEPELDFEIFRRVP
jgi:hypothetical protein